VRWVQQDSIEARLQIFGVAAPSLRLVPLLMGRAWSLSGDTWAYYQPFHLSTGGTTAGVVIVSRLRLPSDSIQFSDAPAPDVTRASRWPSFGVRQATKTHHPQTSLHVFLFFSRN